MFHRLRLQFLVVALVVVLWGCGGSDNPDDATGETSAPTTRQPELGEPDTEVDAAPTTTLAAASTTVASAPTTSEAPQGKQVPALVTVPEVSAAAGGVGIAATLSSAPTPGGWIEEEFLFGGEATSYVADGDLDPSGEWSAVAGETAPYQTRMIVRRPPSENFSGTVLVEWFNVTAGTDTSPDWGYLAEEIERAGHAYVGVSVQAVGVNGVESSRLEGGLVDVRGLKVRDPERYGTLEHPGDAFAFDIMTQAGAAVSSPDSNDLLGGLVPTHVLALGESQSAIFMTTYVNAVHPLVGLYDGFLIHSRGSGAPSPEGDRNGSDGVLIRTDLQTPVFQYEAETDLTALNFAAVRQPDSDFVHTWEVAGTAHADAYSLSVSVGTARDASLGNIIGCETGVNDGPHHETLQAALSHLVDWVVDGQRPPVSPRIETTGEPGSFAVARDDLGIALGGIRTPPVDVPLRVLSGDPSGESGGFCFLFGKTLPFEGDELATLYADLDDFLAQLEASATAAVDQGWLLPDDAATIIAEETARAEELGLN